MGNVNPRIPIPRNPQELLKLATNVRKKHEEQGAASPLHTMEDHNWVLVGPELTKAVELQTEIGQLEKKLEELYGERDRRLPAIKGAVTGSRDILKGIYSQNMKKLGDYGFTVDHTPKAKKKSA